MPLGPPRAAAVVCHPHPQYGGDMDNPVVTAIADALAADGIAALRFNFGGVGGSEGTHGGGPAEVQDVRAALDALSSEVPGVPLVLVGYSFGAWVGALAVAEGAKADQVVVVGPPLAFFDFSFARAIPSLAVIAGDRDQFCPVARLDASLPATIIPGADHFFAGRWDEVAAAVREALR
jgi:alpha/beta superfamily hydrolase